MLTRLVAVLLLALVACSSGPSFEERQARDREVYQAQMAAWNAKKGEPTPGGEVSATREASGRVNVRGYHRADGTYSWEGPVSAPRTPTPCAIGLRRSQARNDPNWYWVTSQRSSSASSPEAMSSSKAGSWRRETAAAIETLLLRQ